MVPTGRRMRIGLRGILGRYYGGHPGDKAWGLTTPSDCPVTQALYSRLLAQQSAISANLTQIVAAARAASPSTRFVDMVNPYLLPANNVCSQDRPGAANAHGQPETWHGAKSVIDGLDRLHEVLSGPDIVRIDLRSEFGTTPMPRLQQTRNFGYPYPSDAGQTKMANVAVAALR
mgnify:CR=1 FL=1